MYLMNGMLLRRLAEYIPGFRHSTYRGRTRGDQRRLRDDRERLVYLEEELEAALGVEYEATLQETLMANAGVSMEIPTGKIQDLPPRPSAQADMMRYPFREAFKHSQRVEINVLLDAGCFASVNENDTPADRQVVASK